MFTFLQLRTQIINKFILNIFFWPILLVIYVNIDKNITIIKQCDHIYNNMIYSI